MGTLFLGWGIATCWVMKFLLVGLLIFFSVFRVRERFWNSNLRITVWDVGQGDSILLQFPGAETMLIDAGGGFGDFNVGARYLVRELARKSILTVDTALLTHADQDHAFGFLGLFPQLKFKEVWMNQFFEKNEKRLNRNIIHQTGFYKIPIRYFPEPETKNISGVRLEILPLMNKSKKTNDHCLLLRITYGKCSILFTGDIEKVGEEEWLQKFPSTTTALKVAHHGSKTSSLDKFLEVAQPQLAMISVGDQNQYGHPSPETLSRFSHRRIPLLRTDRHGAIELTITRNEISYTTFSRLRSTILCL